MVETTKTRGVLLTFWLVIMLIGNILSTISYLFFNAAIASFYPNTPSWIFYIYGLLGLANIVFIIFLFKWKKWPFYALCGVVLIAFIMNLAVGVSILTSIMGLLSPLVLYLIMRPKWQLFE